MAESKKKKVAVDNQEAKKKDKETVNTEEKTSSHDVAEDSTTSDSRWSFNEKNTEVDFTSFILSLYTSAVVNLGEVEDPVTKKKNENVGQAREIINIIGMLKEKTEGNLKEDEKKMLDDVLYQSRMLFLKKTDGIKI